ncbi:MAG: hypothetical protein ACK44A_12205 [Roseateles sp.]
MAQPSDFSDASTPSAQPAFPRLSALARWWRPGPPRPASEPALGYESAQPWALQGGPIDTQPSPD